MDQPLPPNPPIKKPTRTNNQSIIAIILAILLHVLIVAIIYFSIFHNEESPRSEQLSRSDEQPLPAVIITETKPKSPSDITVLTNKAEVSTNDSTPTNQLKTVSQTPIINQKSPSKNTAALDSSTAEPSNNDKAIHTGLSINDDSSLPEYRLKKTKEYEQLDEDIDKDSEQLSKLIDEVKKRNQQQIEQQQTTLSDTQSTPKPVEKTAPNSSVQKPKPQKEEVPLSTNNDYPITPIKSLNNE